MRPQPLIAVSDVAASNCWYRTLQDCDAAGLGPKYDTLVANGTLILQLHRFDVEHHHGRIGDRFSPDLSSQPSLPNRHSTRGTAAASPTAISCLGAFPSPVASARNNLLMPATENLHRK
ncbi:MAG TPA: hypothetical protein VHE81_11045 [Lacipirellulaceae bacterium]|nr:hypothetical protein [Lacipirellulaceae bacterium]